MRRFRRACLALATALVVLAGHSAGVAAQDAAGAVLNAVSYQPIPDREPIHVRVLDNSDASAALKQQFEQALRARGYAIASVPVTLVLTVSPSDEPGFWSYESGALITAERGYNERAGKDLDSYQLNLYDTRKGGLINRPERPAEVSPSRYRLDARLENMSSGRTLWHGWTTADLGRGDGRWLVEAMIPGLADNLGKTARARTVPLQ